MAQGDFSVKANTGKVDKDKMRLARGTGDVWQSSGLMYNSAYRSSYANSGQSAGAFGDVPLYFALMNQNNGGILYWPVNLKEKYEWYRYFYRSDAFVGSAIDLHIELPLSKLILKMPEMKDKEKRLKIQKKYDAMCKKIKLFDKLTSIMMEYLIIGNCYIFFEYNDEKKEWDKMIVLPPEEVNITRIPCTDVSMVEYNPEMTMQIIKNVKGIIEDFKEVSQLKPYLDEEEYNMISKMPFELLKHVVENEKIMMDTDPYTGEGESKVGSFVYHLARRRHEYFDLGVSILERVLIPLLMKEHYKYTQLSLASRNMTPRNKVSAPNVPAEQLDNLREQIDLSMLDPDYTVCTNYEWDWTLIGADQRLIDLQREYEVIENQLFAGLGVTRELLTGEGMYSGGRITVEILNTRYMMVRELFVNMVEENIFKPIAEANGFYEVDKDGYKTYFYPHLSFNRLTIRDNAEVFDSLFQLYQKGSLPVDTILELFNIDTDEVTRKLKRDTFTVKDSSYNDMLRRIYDNVADKVAEGTDLADRIIGNLTGPDGKPLNKVTPEGQAPEGGQDYGSGVEKMLGINEEQPSEEQPSEEQPSETEEKQSEDKKSEEGKLFTDESIKIEENTDNKNKVVKIDLSEDSKEYDGVDAEKITDEDLNRLFEK